MKKNRAQKDIFYIALSSFILVVAWVGFSVYHKWTTSTVSEDLQMQLTPINPSFDTQVIQTLKSRIKVTPVYEVINTAGRTETTPSPSPVASASAKPTVTETITPEPSKKPVL